MTKVLLSPHGRPIIGTAETIPGVALLNPESVTQKPNGTFAFDYSGGTEVDWDFQKTDLAATGGRIFVDEDGNRWPEGLLLWREEREEPDG